MKTLVFCTAYAGTGRIWERRYRRWIDALRAGKLEFTQLLLVDDGSNVLPDWPDIAISRERHAATAKDVTCPDPVLLYHFEERLGRKQTYDFPGWYRSFSFGAQYTEAHGFEKIAHIESDAFPISDRIVSYVSALSEGWTAFWSDKYNWPEICIQVAAGKQVSKCARFFCQPYENFIGVNHELMIPYTCIEKSLIGDRLGEHLDEIPCDVDYVAQIGTHREPSYCCWLRPSTGRTISGVGETDMSADVTAERTAEKLLFTAFGLGGNADEFTGAGWSHAEEYSRWIIGSQTDLFLPAFPGDDDLWFEIWLAPAIYGAAVPQQRLSIHLNGFALYAGEMAVPMKLQVPVPNFGLQQG